MTSIGIRVVFSLVEKVLMHIAFNGISEHVDRNSNAFVNVIETFGGFAIPKIVKTHTANKGKLFTQVIGFRLPSLEISKSAWPKPWPFSYENGQRLDHTLFVCVYDC